MFSRAMEFFVPSYESKINKIELPKHELDFLFIGELATLLDVNPKTIRYYESEGLVTPLRHGKFRTYRRVDVGRLSLIISLRKLGVSIATIKSLSVANEETEEMKLIEDTLKKHADFLGNQLQQVTVQLQDTQKILQQIGALA